MTTDKPELLKMYCPSQILVLQHTKIVPEYDKNSAYKYKGPAKLSSHFPAPMVS